VNAKWWFLCFFSQEYHFSVLTLFNLNLTKKSKILTLNSKLGEFE